MDPTHSGYSVPLSAPLYAEPPYLYRGGNSLICIFRADTQGQFSALGTEPGHAPNLFACAASRISGAY